MPDTQVRLVPSITDLAHSLTIYNAASTPRTQMVMLIIALIGMPLVPTPPTCTGSSRGRWNFRMKAISGGQPCIEQSIIGIP